ncbi:MAG: hypothetical protein ACI8S6_001816 [Myxococcota bacterium]
MRRSINVFTIEFSGKRVQKRLRPVRVTFQAPPEDATMRSLLALACSLLLTSCMSWGSAVADATTVDSGCSVGGHRLFGKVQIVSSFPDLKVQVVSSFPDLKVKMVTSFPDDCGEWQIVESFPDFKIQFVESFPDLKIQYVESFPGTP